MLDTLHCLVEQFILNYPPKRLQRSFYERHDALTIAQSLLHCLIWSSKQSSIETETVEHNQFDKSHILTIGRISETEAYIAPEDTASHAAKGKTKRNAVMYEKGGSLYVYLCYGVHKLINIVTNKVGIPHVILLRSIMPIAGINVMHQRRCKSMIPYNKLHSLNQWRQLGKGPSCLSQCLGIELNDNGEDVVTGNRIWLTERLNGAELYNYIYHSKIFIEWNHPLKYSMITEYLQQELCIIDENSLRLKIKASPRIGIDSVPEDARNALYRFYVTTDQSVSQLKQRECIHVTRKKSGNGRLKKKGIKRKKRQSKPLLNEN